ncbi:hypothetical protein F5887DRAFT_965451 [Amanita rubescens]|nr:hypothetical protein F5887DRAFT_965451 [Amanita rubescens]
MSSAHPSNIPGMVVVSSGPTFPDAENFKISNSSFIDMSTSQEVNIYYEELENQRAFQKLEPYVSHGAFHDSSVRFPPPKCHPSTREQVLKTIKDWIQANETKDRILWLYGSAGTIAEYCISDDKLGAAFFFSRGDSNRNNAYRLFPTLAWQLSSYIPEVKERISILMRRDPLVPTRSIEAQFEKFIMAVPPISTSRIVIIDGVDECVDETIQHHFLTLLLDAFTDGEKVPLRFLVCSRPESHIKEAFYQRSAICLLDQLVQNSSGQFIYAATIVKFVGDKYSHPGKQLDIVLGIRRRSSSSSPFADLDQLYLEILARQPDQYFLKTFLNIMCMCLEGLMWEINGDDFTMLSIVLLKLAEGELWAKLRGLHSLLNISESDLSIRSYHASFPDFLRDAERSSEYYFDRVSWPRAFVELFLEAVVKYVQLPTTWPDKRNFTYLFLNISSLTSALERIPLNQREEVFAPLIPFIHVTIQTSSGSVQPLNLIYWCLETLILTFWGKLHTQKAPSTAISTENWISCY